ncbi:hypothetical protein J7T55_013443 [Diaporthe amygdali]|uniref:uncharacterized protein n=1 Tax=Phomopsis amygdali TaxID=1214568 RepID=UPI0022FDE15C|nr:uncharacterized protein J7T55_013443 [Diaporthe amygdali]KAJ0119206.1 hypothetical protein J7T55_013443 [Diaporthe amygdali]
MPSRGRGSGVAPSGGWDQIGNGVYFLNQLSQYEISNLIRGLDHKDFKLARVWLCFGQDNVADDFSATNHAFLKFDLRPSSHHRWLGVKLEVRKNEMDQIKDRITGQKYTSIELEVNFASVYGGTTLGGLIQILSQELLLSFGFLTTRATCDDEFTQVLLSLKAEYRITGRLRPSSGSGHLAIRNGNGPCTPMDADSFFRNNVFMVLSYYFSEASQNGKRQAHRTAILEVVEVVEAAEVAEVAREDHQAVFLRATSQGTSQGTSRATGKATGKATEVARDSTEAVGEAHEARPLEVSRLPTTNNFMVNLAGLGASFA